MSCHWCLHHISNHISALQIPGSLSTATNRRNFKHLSSLLNFDCCFFLMAVCHRFTQESFQCMEILQRIARGLSVLCAVRAHHPFPTTLMYPFLEFLESLKWPQITRPSTDCLPCSSHHMENHIWWDLSVWQARKHICSCHIVIKHFLHHQLQRPQKKGCWGPFKLHICLFICSTCSTYVSCSESFLKPLKQWSACFPKLVPRPALMQACIRNLS